MPRRALFIWVGILLESEKIHALTGYKEYSTTNTFKKKGLATIQRVYYVKHPSQSVYPYQIVSVSRTGECAAQLVKILPLVVFYGSSYVAYLLPQYLFQSLQVLARQVLSSSTIVYTHKRPQNIFETAACTARKIFLE
jgi:hypothetical protein